MAAGGYTGASPAVLGTRIYFGTFSNDLLVGNFGDGRINAYNPSTGAFLGQLQDTSGSPIVIDGLWGLRFGNGGTAGSTSMLFFTAGIEEESHGLFGSLVPVTPSLLPVTGEPSIPLAPTLLVGLVALGAGFALRRQQSRSR